MVFKACRLVNFRCWQKVWSKSVTGNAWFYILCGLGIFSIIYMKIALYSIPLKGSPISSAVKNASPISNRLPTNPDLEQSNNSLVVENRGLIFITHKDAYRLSSVVVAMNHCRFKYKSVYYEKNNVLKLTNENAVGLYSVIVFEDFNTFLWLSEDSKVILNKYCTKYGVGVMFFITSPSKDLILNAQLHNFPINFSNGVPIQRYQVLKSVVSDIALTDVIHDVDLMDDWVVFHANHSTYQVLSHGMISKESTSGLNAAIVDQGLHDGIKRIFFGNKHDFWLHKILFLDALAFLTQGAMKVEKNKFIQIDIDDMFLGSPGTKMTLNDVEALYNAQKVWQEHYVANFTFFLGFSGKFYRSGLESEQHGDEKLLNLSKAFRWFDHTYSHFQAHKTMRTEDIIEQFELSKVFAQEHNLVVDRTYAVAPHHSGVYPVHKPLYTAWKQVWGIQVTSTEEYPNLKPPSNIRGFIYDNIQVLPRQVCGLYTKTLTYKEYPGGPAALEANIHGGDLFDTVLYNFVNIYMTHQQNYGSDRLAIYTFDKLFRLFAATTTLKFKSAPPTEIAKAYFEKYPEEKNPVWSNPCNSKRHLEIWHNSSSCDHLPNLLIIGPQKTGTTALYTFLKLHPNISSNVISDQTFEEVQFFGSSHYYNGLDWYLQLFPRTAEVVFEKSATYFDKAIVPKQASALLPRAKIIIILVDPIERAASWYYHQRAHKNSTALNHSLYEIITSNESAQDSVKNLKSRLLHPGFYYEHIQQWRLYYPDNQILYLDGELLRSDPVKVMWQVQQFLQLSNLIDYKDLLRYDDKKGFYCVKSTSSKNYCLGKSKGRRKEYGQVDPSVDSYLKTVFKIPNLYLKQLLSELGKELPRWLDNW